MWSCAKKINCCFYGNNHCHVSEFVSASGVPNVYAAQVEVESGGRICRTLGEVLSNVMLHNKIISFYNTLFFQRRYRKE